MQVKDLIKKLKALNPDMEMYTNDRFESGGCISFNIEPKITQLVVCKSYVIPYNGQTFIDEKKYHKDDDLVIKEFEAVLIGV